MNSIKIYFDNLDNANEQNRLGELVDIAIAKDMDYETLKTKSNLINAGMEFPVLEAENRFYAYKEALEWLINY